MTEELKDESSRVLFILSSANDPAVPGNAASGPREDNAGQDGPPQVRLKERKNFSLSTVLVMFQQSLFDGRVFIRGSTGFWKVQQDGGASCPWGITAASSRVPVRNLHRLLGA